jgi:hypothetical protein
VAVAVTTSRRWGIFTADGRLAGTWDTHERAQEYLDRYGDGAYIQWRDVTYTEWAKP